MVGEQGNHQASCWHDPSLTTVFCEMFLPYNLSLSLVTEKPLITKEVDMVSGGCMAVQREVFRDLNGFDERFFMFYEDADLCLRARKAGFKVYHTPAISVVHHVGSSNDDPTLFFFRVYRSKLQFIRKHYSSLSYVAAYVMVIGGIVLRIPAYALLGAAGFNKKFLGLAKVYTKVLKRFVISQ
jgi:GT2 family glycosyltransferase